MTNSSMMDGLWAAFGYHGLLWLILLVVIAAFTVALVRDWRKDRPSHKSLDWRSRS